MSTQSIRLQVETIRSLASTSITNDYIEIGDPYLHPVRIYHLQNATDVDLIWSWNGTTDNGVIRSGSFILLDITTNKTLPQGQFIAQGSNTYIRAFTDLDPTLGAVYLTVWYGQDN